MTENGNFFLITGGTGFIGSHLALALRERGAGVRVLGKEVTTYETENIAALRKAGVDVRLADILQEDERRRALDGVTCVFHVAAAMREGNLSDAVFWEINVHATERFLEESAAAGVNRFVYCSTVGVLGRGRGRPLSEDDEPRPRDIYQVTKEAAERKVRVFHQSGRLPAVIVRPAEVYGPGDPRLLKLFRAIRRGRFVMIGSGEGKHHLIYIQDLVEAMLLAAERPEALGETFILAGAEPVRLRDLVRIIAERLGVRLRRARVPLAPVRLAAVVMEKICQPLGVQPPLYPRRVEFFNHDYAFDISRARRILGFEPRVGLPDGVDRTVKAYEAGGLL
jgi:nucleoside-diphosphate-sugar epimerase